MTNWKEIRVDVYVNAGPTLWMRLVHLPTGTTVTGEGVSQIKLREELLAQLEQEIATLGG